MVNLYWLKNFFCEDKKLKLERIIIALLLCPYIFKFFNAQIFFDDKRNFQWASIAALIALFSVVIQFFTNQKTIDANITAKARIEWIQAVRDLAARYISTAYECRRIIRPLYEEKYEQGKGSKISTNEHKELEEKWHNLLYEYNLILLYFENGTKSDSLNTVSNKEIIESIHNLKNEVKKFKVDVSKVGIEIKEKHDFDANTFYYKGVEPFRNKMRTYLKGEWNRAKNGK